MRRRDRAPDPDAARELAAIDAALAGGPVGPEEADLARLATLLVAERPAPDPAFRAALDDRVASRFAGSRPDAQRARTQARTGGAADATRAEGVPGGTRRAPRPTRRGLLGRIPLLPAASATGLAALVAILVAVNVGGGGGGGMTSDSAVSGGAAMSEAPGGGAAAGDTDSGAVAPPPAFEPESAAPADGATSGTARDGAAEADRGGRGGGSTAPPSSVQSAPLTADGGRKVERSSTIELGAPAERVDDVAQGVLGVVARSGGIVDASTIATREGGGEARFELRIPAARLQRTLAQLSELPDARVLSRTDDALDVNQAYVSVQRKLSAAEARRTATANALRRATDQDEIDRLSAELATLDRQIAGWERDQRALDRRVDFSKVALTVRTDERAGDEDDGGGFTPGAAFDDAGRLLAVTAGVAVIAAAALVPLALLAACTWPLARALRRRRREQALDAT
jgi:hypothetical protein